MKVIVPCPWCGGRGIDFTDAEQPDECGHCSGYGRVAPTVNPNHEVDGVEFIPVCDECWRPVNRTDDDQGWEHAVGEQ